MANPMSAAQRRKIFKLAGERGLDGDALHETVAQVTGKSHISALTMREAIAVIDRLEVKPPNERPYYDKTKNHAVGRQNAAQKATAEQKRWISEMARLYGWVDGDGNTDMTSLNTFLSNKFGVSMLEWLDMRTAEKVIEGLKIMVNRKQNARVSKEDVS